jgi:glycosyltransferase involved in cell wall biosynthesis
MRVLLANKFLYPKGGAEIVCLGLAKGLERRGHETLLFGMSDPRNPDSPDADCYPSPLDYHADRGVPRKIREALRTIYSPEARAGFARLLDRRRPDLIHMHNIYHQLTPSILAPARKRGIPVLLTLHDYKLVCPVYTFLREGRPCEDCLGRSPLPVLRGRCKGGSLAESAVLFAEAQWHRLARSYARGVTLFTSPSRFLREKVMAGGIEPDRILLLPNALPLDAEWIDRAYEPPPSGEQPELLWIGRISAEKGLSTLLRAVTGSERALRLTIVGDGPQEGELRSLAAEMPHPQRIRWLGRRRRDEIPDLILAADATVMPSEWYENAPLSILESLALGRPVIASRMGGIPEMLVEGETAWLYPAGDVDALRAILAEWADAPRESRRRGERSHALVRAEHHPELILDRTLAIYERLLAQAR